MVNRIRDALSATYEVRVWQWVTAMTMLMVLCFGAVFGGVTYIRDQREEARRDAAEATFQAELASYENARDEHARCVAAVDTRDQFRRLLLQTDATFAGFIAAVELVNPESPVLDGLRKSLANYEALIEQDWPVRSIEDCPDEPVAPEPPT